jgi:hypothetical protein
MTIGLVALLVGLFVVPVWLLWLGHRLRRRTPRQRATFWGGLAGYGAGACAALAVGMSPAEMWSGDDSVRGALGLWAMVVLPAAGALVALVSRRASQ